MKILRLVVFIFLSTTMVIAAGCGGSNSSSGPGISGVVYDISNQTASPAYGVTVTLRKAADNSTLATTTTGGDGSFTISNVPASQDVYINLSKATYATFNSEVINTTSDVSGKVLYIALAQNVQSAVDLIAWNDPSYSGIGSQSWLAIDIYDMSGNEVSGVTVTAAPADATILYNNGLDVFLPTGPTTTLTAHSSVSLVGGYSSSSAVYSLTLTDSSKTRTVTLPLVLGEMTYLSVYPW